jgi:hypothetical protein
LQKYGDKLVDDYKKERASKAYVPKGVDDTSQLTRADVMQMPDSEIAKLSKEELDAAMARG